MQALRVSQVLIRSFSSTARNRLQNREDNDIPLYLKGGIVDNILYRVTMALCLGGTVYSLYS
ncbi:COX7A1 isoform 4, partial [Pongo abelii]